MKSKELQEFYEQLKPEYDEMDDNPITVAGIFIYPGAPLLLKEIRYDAENNNFITSEEVNFKIMA